MGYDYEMEAMEISDYNQEQGFAGCDAREDAGMDWDTRLEMEDGGGDNAPGIYREFEGEDDREGELDPYSGCEIDDDPQDPYEDGGDYWDD